jgi:hypothetical protein
MSRRVVQSASALVAVILGLIWIAPRVSGQIIVGVPTPQQFSAQGPPSTKNGEYLVPLMSAV